MKVSDYLVNELVRIGVTDVFGIPGGVILEFIYALERQKNRIKAHLNFHEQASAYAACGYAQYSGKLGAAYCTCGPGITNMITAIADAYFDSIPVLFITAHSHADMNCEMRIAEEQQLNPIPLIEHITKYAVRIENTEEVCPQILKACELALSDRKGPVLLDFSSKILKTDILVKESSDLHIEKKDVNMMSNIEVIKKYIEQSHRPIFLIGDGIRQEDVIRKIVEFSQKVQIPVISSRFAQDIMPEESLYYGYIGSHATRYSNFILAKSDLIIALGNRMAFNLNSKSFGMAMQKKRVIRIEVDESEFIRKVPNSFNINTDVNSVISDMLITDIKYANCEDWVNICNVIKEKLFGYDVKFPVDILSEIIAKIDEETPLVCDIGNNELWVSRAYAYSKSKARIIHSKSLKTVGSAIGKAIGVYYACNQVVVCFVGDQGFQFNIQELQYLKDNNLPIIIILINNNSSGMLRTAEKNQGYSQFIHTTYDSGYSTPNFKNVVKAYGLEYFLIEVKDDIMMLEQALLKKKPCIIEFIIDDTVDADQYLPKGNPCQKFTPEIPVELYEELDNM